MIQVVFFSLSTQWIELSISLQKQLNQVKERTKSRYNRIFTFEPERYCWSSCVCVWGDYAVYGLWASSTAYQKSGPFFLSLWSLCSLYTHASTSPRLSLTGRRSGGVWGKWWGHCTPTQFSSCSWHCVFSYPLCFLTLCIFAFFLNPLALAEFQLANWLQV